MPIGQPIPVSCAQREAPPLFAIAPGLGAVFEHGFGE